MPLKKILDDDEQLQTLITAKNNNTPLVLRHLKYLFATILHYGFLIHFINSLY